LWLTKQPGSELPFLVFFYGSILLFLKAQFKPNLSTIPFFFSGILIGMAMLIRPIGLGLGIILAGFLLISEQNRSFGYRMVLALMLLGGNLITILPWEYSVYSKTGKIIPLSSGGAAGIYDGLTFGVRSYGFRQKIALPPDIIHLMEDFDANLSMDNSLADVASRLFEEFQDRPITVAKLFGIKAIRSWFGTDSHRGETFLTIIQIFYLFLFLVGTWFSYRENSFVKKVLILIWVLIAYFWGMAILASPLLRYMTPAIGLLFLTVPALLKIALKWFSKETLFIDSRL
jgi:hypothetical protein